MRGQKKEKKTLYWFDSMEHPTGNCGKNQYDNRIGGGVNLTTTYLCEGNNNINMELLQLW